MGSIASNAKVREERKSTGKEALVKDMPAAVAVAVASGKARGAAWCAVVRRGAPWCASRCVRFAAAPHGQRRCRAPGQPRTRTSTHAHCNTKNKPFEVCRNGKYPRYTHRVWEQRYVALRQRRCSRPHSDSNRALGRSGSSSSSCCAGCSSTGGRGGRGGCNSSGGGSSGGG